MNNLNVNIATTFIMKVTYLFRMLSKMLTDKDQHEGEGKQKYEDNIIVQLQMKLMSKRSC